MLWTQRLTPLCLVAAVLVTGLPHDLQAQSSTNLTAAPALQTGAACEFSDVPGAIYWSSNNTMTMSKLAALAAPILWFSPDEPLLLGLEGEEIRLPEALPFEETPDAPVLYYQFDEVVGLAEEALDKNVPDKGDMVINFDSVGAFRLSYFAYYSSEEGLGRHQHDVEAAEFKIVSIWSDGRLIGETHGDRCAERNYILVVTRVTGKAHGIKWFWNVSHVDTESKFPFTMMVEEGKHAFATDKNGDGYFTPGYDVDRYVNDAWGIRDNIRGGALLSGGYAAWMTKVRHPEHRVLPPLPEDSPLWPQFSRRTSYAEGGNAVYELRPFPSASLSEDDPGLHHFMESKEVEDWPDFNEAEEFKQFTDWVTDGNAVKSLAISLYADGDLGFAWVFPLFIVKNMEVAVSGGFLVWRMYLKDQDLQDFGWTVMYANSASRWIDSYFAAGVEWDAEVVDGVKSTEAFFILETGLKFRVNVTTSALKFLAVFTDFWGFRAGIKNYGFFDIDRLTYVLEFGAGAW
jgi:hypothetical protein